MSNNLVAFDDPALRSSCEVYCSLDGVVYARVGTALEPCTNDLPFEIPFDEGLKGVAVNFKFCAIGDYGRSAALASAKEHRCTLPQTSSVAIVATQ